MNGIIGNVFGRIRISLSVAFGENAVENFRFIFHQRPAAGLQKPDHRIAAVVVDERLQNVVRGIIDIVSDRIGSAHVGNRRSDKFYVGEFVSEGFHFKDFPRSARRKGGAIDDFQRSFAVGLQHVERIAFRKGNNLVL